MGVGSSSHTSGRGSTDTRRAASPSAPSAFHPMAAEEAGELRLVLVEKEARIVTLEAENAALRKEKAAAAAMEKRLRQWAGLPDELLTKVLEAAGWQEGGFGFSQASATVRLVSTGWKAMHDALVTRLVLRYQTTDDAMGKLVRRFPAVVSLEVKGGKWGQRAALTDKGLRAVSSLASLTFLDLSWCCDVTDEGVQAVIIFTALKSLNLFMCDKVTDEGVRAVIK